MPEHRPAKIAIVTGGTRGIGAAISRAFHTAGYRVVASYGHNDDAAQAFHLETGIPVHKWDVSDFQACADGVQTIHRDLGPISILVNNAGITRDAMLHKMHLDDWHAVIRTNLDSLFHMTRAVINDMREQNFGRIISISSVNAQKGQIGQTQYSAAKAGVIGFTKALALEGARKGITANVIAPGYTETDMISTIPQDFVTQHILPQIPAGRLGTAPEIARCALFLAADEADWITGSTLSVNGGQYLS